MPGFFERGPVLDAFRYEASIYILNQLGGQQRRVGKEGALSVFLPGPRGPFLAGEQRPLH